MKTCFICWMILNTGLVWSQQPTVVLKGKITDANGDALPYTKISETQNRNSTLSNQRGTFYLNVPAEKASLRLSYVGYVTIDTTLYFKHNPGDTLFVSFRMIPTVKELGTVDISSKPYTRVFETTNLNILDYTFFGQNILLLVNGKENYQIRLLDSQEKVLTRQALHFKPKGFVKDCLGILHIVSDDSLYPVFFDSELFSFPDAISIQDYKEIIAPCVASSETCYFLKYVTDFDQTIQYFSQRKTDDSYQTLRVVRDAQVVKDVTDFAQTLLLVPAPNPMAELNANSLKSAHERFQDETFFENVLTVPTYAPLIRTNSAIYIFDHLADSCFVFSQQSDNIRQFTITYHLQKGWMNELIEDEAHEKIYAVHQVNGIFELAEINLETGALLESTKLEEHTYPEKIRIKDGWIYYLHHDVNLPGYNKLYKVRLKDF